MSEGELSLDDWQNLVAGSLTRIPQDFENFDLVKLKGTTLPLPLALEKHELVRSPSFEQLPNPQTSRSRSQIKGAKTKDKSSSLERFNLPFELRQNRQNFRELFAHSSQEAQKQKIWVEFSQNSRDANYEYCVSSTKEFVTVYRCIQILFDCFAGLSENMTNGPTDAGTSREEHGRKTVRRVESFKGLAGEDFEKWLARFEVMCMADKMKDKADWAIVMPTYFDGNAFEYYSALNTETKTDYARLVAKLREGYVSKDRAKFAGLQLSSRKQAQNESVSDFECDIRKMGKLAHPKMDEASLEEIMMGAFIHGLRHDYKKQILAQDIKTFSDAVQYVQKLETIGEMSGPGENSSPGYQGRRSGPARFRAVRKDPENEEGDEEDEPLEAKMIAMCDTVEKISTSTARIETKLGEHEKLHKQTKERMDTYETAVNRRLDRQDSTVNSLTKRMDGFFRSNYPQKTGFTPNSNRSAGFPGQGGPKQGDNISLICWRCQKQGHISRDCPLPQPTQNNFNRKPGFKPRPNSGQTQARGLQKNEVRVILQETSENEGEEEIEEEVESEPEFDFSSLEPGSYVIGTIRRTDMRDNIPPAFIRHAKHTDFSGRQPERQSRAESPLTKRRKALSKEISARLGPKMPRKTSEQAANDRAAPSSTSSSGNGIISILCMLISAFWSVVEKYGGILPPKPLSLTHVKQGLSFAFICIEIYAILTILPYASKNILHRILAYGTNLAFKNALKFLGCKKHKLAVIIILCSLTQKITAENKHELKILPYVAPNPMVCGTTTIKDFWKIPRQMPCQIAPINKDEIPRSTKIRIYKFNFIEHESKAWHCTKIMTQKRVWSRFVRDHFFKEKDTKMLRVSASECESMVENKQCTISPNKRDNTWNDDDFNPKHFSGRLTRNEDIWQTKNEIPDYWPYGGHWCCKWHRRTVENCYWYKTHVYKKYGEPDILSPSGDIEHCRYKEKGCQLSDGSYLKWEINDKSKCKYIPWKIITGKRWSNNFMASDNSIGLTFTTIKPFEGCDGEILLMTDQNIPIQILGSDNWLLGLPDLIPFNEHLGDSDEDFLNSLEEIRKGNLPKLPPNTLNDGVRTVYDTYMRDAFSPRGGKDKLKFGKNATENRAKILNLDREALKRLDTVDQILIKNAPEFLYKELKSTNKSLNMSQTILTRNRREGPKYKPSFVTSDHLAAALQGIWITMSEHLKFSFEQAMQVTCANINLMMKLLYAQILENPTLAMRQLFASEYLIARAGGEVVEITPCQEIALKNVRFVPMEKGLCTKDIPVQYQIPGINGWMEGYLDPLTKNIQRHSSETDCEKVNILPLQFGDKYFVYNANKSGIQEITTIPEILIFQANATINYKIEPHVVRHLKMYNFSEFQTSVTTNQLLRAAGRRNQIYGQHGFMPRNFNDTVTINGDTPTGRNAVENWWSTGPFAGYFQSLAEHSYKIWIFVVALYVTFGWAASCCFPDGFAQKLNMRTLASKAREKIAVAQQRRERRKLDIADARATELIELANRTFQTSEDSAPNLNQNSQDVQIAGIRFQYDRANPVATFEKLAEVIQRLQNKINTAKHPDQKHSLEQGINAAKRQILAVSMDVCSGAATEPSQPRIPKMETEICQNVNGQFSCKTVQNEISRIATAPVSEIIPQGTGPIISPQMGIYPEIPTPLGKDEVLRELGVIWNDQEHQGNVATPLSLYLNIGVKLNHTETGTLIVLWDTGAQVSLMPIEVVQNLGMENCIEATPIRATGVGGSKLGLKGRVKVMLEFDQFDMIPNFAKKFQNKVQIPHYFEVTTNPAVKTAYLGYDFATIFTKHSVDYSKQEVKFTWDRGLRCLQNTKLGLNCPIDVRPDTVDTKDLEKLTRVAITAKIYQVEKTYGDIKVKKDFTLPPRSVLHIPCVIDNLEKGKEDLQFAPLEEYEDTHQIIVTRHFFTRGVIRSKKLDKGKTAYLIAYNANECPVYLKKGVHLGDLIFGEGPTPDTDDGYRTVHRVIQEPKSKIEKTGPEISAEEKQRILTDLGLKPTAVELSD